MNLPLAIDVAIGLLFIYLTLSLLTSEIQELIGTIFQWRAEHLKQSIQQLLTDEKLADQLYQAPLIQSLNQEGKGPTVEFFRQMSDRLVQLIRTLTGARNVFNRERSGPSYIPEDTFSTALLRQINIQDFSQKISELAVRRFGTERLLLIEEILDSMRNSLGDSSSDYSLLQKEFNSLKRSLDEIVDDFSSRRTTLANSINRATEELQQFLTCAESTLTDNHHCQEILLKRLPYLKQAIVRRQLEPTVSEVLRLIYCIAEDNLLDESRSPDTSELPPKLVELALTIRREYPDVVQQIIALPPALKDNLLTLAERAQAKADSLEAGVLQLEQEVATWFDHSMARASGVYKRNAKGIAIIIGFLIAVSVNADTLYIVSRLSKDSTLRSTVSQAANQIVSRNPAPTEAAVDLTRVKNDVDAVLSDLPLPIGWNPANVRQQRPLRKYLGIPLLSSLIGWMITGVALSMGASFWYDLLGKVMRVKNSGRSEGSR